MGKTLASPRIERGMTRLVVPHEGEAVVFSYPSIGSDSYTAVGKRILEQGMNLPTGDNTASLLHAAYCIPEVENEPEFQNVREIMKNRWLWVFNRNLWTPQGVYVVQDLEAIRRSQPLNQDELEKMLEGGKDLRGVRLSKDGRVRFAQKGSYQLGKHTPESLAKDGFIVASYGIDGAEKLGEVSAKFRNKPYVYDVEADKPEQRISALVGIRYVDGGLVVDDYDFDDDWYGHAFGVLK